MPQKSTTVPAPAEPRRATFLASPGFWLRIFIAAQMILLAVEFSPDISTNGDDAVYYILGKSLATGQGYRSIHLAEAPVMAQFPIVFPAFLAITHLFTDKPLVAKILVMALGCLIALIGYFLFRRWLPPLAIPLLLVTAMSWVLNQHAVELLSETPYIFLSLLALLLLEKSVDAPRRKWLFWLTILVSITPINCRSVGIAFSAAFLLDCMLRKRYRYAVAHLAGVVVSIGLFKILVSTQNVYLLPLLQKNTYDPEQGFVTVAEMLGRVASNLGMYISQILPQSALPSAVEQSPELGLPVGLLLTAIIGLGWVRNLFLSSRIVSIYVLFYTGIMLMWQVQWTSVRFLSAILPFLFFLFAIGIGSIGTIFPTTSPKSREKKAQRWGFRPLVPFPRICFLAVWVVLGLFSIDNIAFQIHIAGQPSREKSPDWVNFYSCADWIRQNTPPEAIVVSRKPELAYLRSKRRGMIYPYSHDEDKVIAEIRKEHASYIIVDGFFWTGTTRRYLYPALEKHPEMYRIVYAVRNPDTYVLELADRN